MVALYSLRLGDVIRHHSQHDAVLSDRYVMDRHSVLSVESSWPRW